MKRFADPELARTALSEQQYIASDEISTIVYLAQELGKPLLTEGPAGVGKTELAKAIASALGRELIRLQCYEGLDESKALYEWEYSKQLLYTQLLRDKLNDTLGQAGSLAEAADRLAQEEDVFFSGRFLLQRPLLRAILCDEPTVLLIDEIDRADAEFEAFLLEVLSDFQISVPELGTLSAKHRPFVGPDEQQHSRTLGSPQAALPLSFRGLPLPGGGGGSDPAQGPGPESKVGASGSRIRSGTSNHRLAQIAVDQRDSGLGSRAAGPQCDTH